MILGTSFVVNRVLFRVLCLGVFVSTFDLCVKLVETVLQLVILVAVLIVDPGCGWLVRFVVLVIGDSHAWGGLHTSIVCLCMFTVIGTVGRIGRYCYR